MQPSKRAGNDRLELHDLVLDVRITEKGDLDPEALKGSQSGRTLLVTRGVLKRNQEPHGFSNWGGPPGREIFHLLRDRQPKHFCGSALLQPIPRIAPMDR